MLVLSVSPLLSFLVRLSRSSRACTTHNVNNNRLCSNIERRRVCTLTFALHSLEPTEPHPTECVPTIDCNEIPLSRVINIDYNRCYTWSVSPLQARLWPGRLHSWLPLYIRISRSQCVWAPATHPATTQTPLTMTPRAVAGSLPASLYCSPITPNRTFQNTNHAAYVSATRHAIKYYNYNSWTLHLIIPQQLSCLLNN